MNDLSQKPEYATKVNEMKEKLQKMQKELSDPLLN